MSHGKRKGSSTDYDSEDSDSRPRYSSKQTRTRTHSSDEEPQPGTSAQALQAMRKEQDEFQRGQARTHSKKSQQEDKAGTKRVRPANFTNSESDNRTNESKKKKATSENASVPSMSAREYILSQQKEIDLLEYAPGRIKKISMYNFMCHSSFHKEWHPNLNFVTGENGSGKSALLSGIIIGLGAKALATSRTKSITQLIQTGKDYAKTEITLINSGGINVQKYGEEFTIERVLSVKGSSQYKIKCKGKSRPLLRAELDHILLNLDIQLDNPLMILNQETARSFLRSKDPKTKYKLFYDGTMFSKLAALLSESQENMDVSRRNVDNYLTAITAVENQTKILKASYKKIKQVEKIKETVNKIWEEYLWAVVVDVEKRKETKEFSLLAATNDLEKYEEKLEETRQKKAEIMGKASAKEEEAASRASLKTKEISLNQLRATYSKIRSQVGESRSKLRGVDTRIEAKRVRMEECKATIDEIKNKAKEAEEKIQAEYRNKKEKLDSHKAVISQELNTLKQDADQFKSGADAVRKQMNEVKDQVDILNRQISKTQQHLTNLRKSTSNKFSVYGKEMEELIAKLNANERQFKKKPIGPIGAYCTVKDSKWVHLIEFIIGAATTAFLVDNTNDYAVFKKLMESVYQKYENGNNRVKRPTIYVTQFLPKAHDITNGEARAPGIQTVLDLIEIEGSNPVIFNALCDMSRVEKLILFENKKAAMTFIGNVNQCPPTCKGGYSLDFYNVTPNPDYAIWALNDKFQATYLKASTKEQISSLRKRLTELQTELNDLKPTLNEKMQEENRLREQHNGRIDALKEVRDRLTKVEIQIQQLNQRRNYQPDLTSQMEELGDLTKDYEDHVTIKEAAQKCLDENGSKLEELSAQKAKLEKEITDLSKLISSFAEEADGRQVKLRKIENVLSRLNTMITKGKKDQEELKRNLDSIDAELQRKLKTAEEKCPRVETNSEPGELENEFKTMKSTIEQSSKILGSKEEIERKLRAKLMELKLKKEEYKTFDYLIGLISCLLTAQDSEFKIQRENIGNLLCAYFYGMANARGYKGNLLLDHNDQELYYFVCPDGDAHSKTQKVMENTSNKMMRKQLVEYSLGLSGGERSYATICFIISMWKVMACPFFMLDEFDVFMDPFNRKSSQSALIAHAQKFCTRQFFFFTPLELTQIPEEDKACVLRMFPPVRDHEDNANAASSPDTSVGEVENTDPSDGSQSTQPNSKKPQGRSRPMKEKTNSRR